MPITCKSFRSNALCLEIAHACDAITLIATVPLPARFDREIYFIKYHLTSEHVDVTISIVRSHRTHDSVKMHRYAIHLDFPSRSSCCLVRDCNDASDRVGFDVWCIHRWWVIRPRVCSDSMYLLLAWLVEIKAAPSQRYLEFQRDADVWFTDRSIPMKENSFQRLRLHVIEFKRRACLHKSLTLTVVFFLSSRGTC